MLQSEAITVSALDAGELQLLTAIAEAVDNAKPHTAESMARATYEACRAVCAAWGMSPDSEVLIRSPEQEKHFSEANTGRCGNVAFEAGPHDWAVPASFLLMERCGGKLVEPYCGFDLCFYPSEDK